MFQKEVTLSNLNRQRKQYLVLQKGKTILQNGDFLLNTLISSQDFCCFQEGIFIASMIQKI